MKLKKKNKSFGEAIAVGSALAGAALGAAAVMLSDKKNQAKIKKTVDGMSKDAMEMGKNIKKEAEKFMQSAKKEEKKIEKTVAKATAKPVAKKAAVKKVVKKAPAKKTPAKKKA